MFNPKTDPRACVVCKSERVHTTGNMRPSGVAETIVCEHGHETNGMPTRAFFDSQEF